MLRIKVKRERDSNVIYVCWPATQTWHKLLMDTRIDKISATVPIQVHNLMASFCPQFNDETGIELENGEEKVFTIQTGKRKVAK